MKQQLQAIVTVLSLVNPGAMFAQIEVNRSRSQQVADATKAVLATNDDTRYFCTHWNAVAPPVRFVT